MQNAAFGVHLGQLQPASPGNTQTVAEHEQQKTPVAGRVAATLGGVNELVHLGGNKVLAVFPSYPVNGSRARTHRL